MPTVDVLGYSVAAIDLTAAADLIVAWCREGERGGPDRHVVTLNPEFVVQGADDPRFAAALRCADLRVADGVGIVWAARRAGHRLPGRVPGVELAGETMARGGAALRVYFFGGAPGVADAAAERARDRFGITVAGAEHGYLGDDVWPDVARRIRRSGANLVLAGLGARQERFLAEQRGALGGGVGIGVGGTLDVLAGRARRTPGWTRRWGLEWAWRVGLDPKRWHRAPRLLRFAVMALRRGRRGVVD